MTVAILENSTLPPRDPVHVRGIRVADQVVIEVDALARVVTGRGSKTRRHLPATNLQPDLLVGYENGLWEGKDC